MSSNKKKILIVDDNSMSLEIYKHGLIGSDVEMIFCQSPIEASEIIKRLDLQGVITDLIMPEVSGIELLKDVNQYQKNCFKFLITGNTELDTIIHIVNNIGVDRIFLKPIQIDGNEIKESLNNYL